MKRMLIIHSNNFLQGGMGENNRVIQLTHMFKELGYEMDLFSFENFSPDSTFRNFTEQNKDNMIKKLFLFDFKEGYKEEAQKRSRFSSLPTRAVRKLMGNPNKKYLHNWVPDGAQRLFTDVLSDNQYDVIAIFYTYLAPLLMDRSITAKKVYFMEDSMFLQQYSWEKNTVKGISLGKLMDEEIERMKCFDEVFCISNDERIFYEKITGKNMYFLPHLLPQDTKITETPVKDRRWDVYFIGFNNPFNVAGLEWFLEEVYPFLDKNLKILLIGSATKNLEIKYSNVEIIPYAADLEEIYSNVKVAICPMFQGTGMKVKVVEAMAKGLPIVCNERGVDGLPDKSMSGCLVTQDAKVFAEYINRLILDESYYSDVSGKMNNYYKLIFDRNYYTQILEDILS